jgi:hypothetical protein
MWCSKKGLLPPCYHRVTTSQNVVTPMLFLTVTTVTTFLWMKKNVRRTLYTHTSTHALTRVYRYKSQEGGGNGGNGGNTTDNARLAALPPFCEVVTHATQLVTAWKNKNCVQRESSYALA